MDDDGINELLYSLFCVSNEEKTKLKKSHRKIDGISTFRYDKCLCRGLKIHVFQSRLGGSLK